MKLIFEKNYRPYKSGQIVEFETNSELRNGNWFLANGIAKEYCDCDENHDEKEKCSGCEEMARKAKESEEVTEQPKTKAVAKEKTTKKE